MEIPAELRYTDEHEWARLEDDGRVRVGITDYAQDALGDIVFVELPKVGKAYGKGDTMSEVESTKSVGEVYAPMAATVVEVNEALVESPELINTSPYDDGWIAVLQPDDEGALDDLLGADAYQALTE